MTDVICMGELLVEFVATEKNRTITDASGFVKAPGGAPANVAVALSNLGLTSRFVGKVGTDPFGEYLRKSLQEKSVNTEYLLNDSDARTTAVFVAVWDGGRKDLCFYRNPGADIMLNQDEVGEAMLSGGRCFHFGSVSLAEEPAASAQKKLLELARAKGLMISFDPNYRPTLWPNPETAQKEILESLHSCHLAKVSDEEWEIVSGTQDLENGIRKILDCGVELLVLSRGEKGALATNGEYQIEIPGITVEVLETTGAGDGFLAAMIMQLLPLREKQGSLAKIPKEQVEAALHFANAVGALTCLKMGAIPALPSLDEVNQFLKNQKIP
ncbi:MAG: carbohydrate kinase [SAR324 cluster bacterium]|nr:carbohydrate kinase [SAR324 cluster bacterium]